MSQGSHQKIVITGTSRGLGRAMVDAFIALGHQVAGCARSAEAVGHLQAKYGAPHRFDVVDVASDAAVRQWAEQVLAGFGTPDMLINNAAVINRSAAFWKVPAGEFDRVVTINVMGVANVLRHFLPAMIHEGRGVIINFSSYWGRSSSPQVAPYCATKWAIEGLTQSLAEELPAGMAAIPFNPGIINTEMLQTCFGSDAERYGDPRSWAESAVPFLLKLGPRDNGKQTTAPGQ